MHIFLKFLTLHKDELNYFIIWDGLLIGIFWDAFNSLIFNYLR
jgi:hypothetical protein